MKVGIEQEWIGNAAISAGSCVVESRPASICLCNALPPMTSGIHVAFTVGLLRRGRVEAP